MLVTTYNDTQLVRRNKELSVTKGELVWVVIEYPRSQIKRSREKKRTNRKPFSDPYDPNKQDFDPLDSRERERRRRMIIISQFLECAAAAASL
jgi:hypothetical protein